MASLVYPRENYSNWRKGNFKNFRADNRQLIDTVADNLVGIQSISESGNKSENERQAADVLEKFENRF